MTELLTTMESDKAHLEGLEHKLKTVESLARKILLDSHDKEISLEEAAEGISDALRYTMIIEDEDYSEVTEDITDKLVEAGNEVSKFKNYWLDTSRSYQGINALFETPNGTIFELQFHTPVSYDVKSDQTHELYEIVRDENSTPEEVEEANEKMDELSDEEKA